MESSNVYNMQNQDKKFLKEAIEKAKESIAKGGFPAGALIIKDGKIIGSGISIGNVLFDPTAHGEISAIRNACANLKSNDLSNAVIYTSMESCSMCLSAIMWAGISKVVFACSKTKVSEEYYGGHYDTSLISDKFIHPIELIHVPKLEEEALAVVREWEKSI